MSEFIFYRRNNNTRRLPETPVYLTDRTTGVTDQRCGMERWWYKEHDGTGIVPTTEPDHFSVGSDIHADFQRLTDCPASHVEPTLDQMMTLPDGTHVWDSVVRQMDMETLFRRLGWAIAFGRFIRPKFIGEGGSVVATEHEMTLERGDLWTAVKPDLIYNTPEGLMYREYKTVTGVGPSWIAHWPLAIQVHLGLAAMKEEFCNEKLPHPYTLGHGIIQGIDKGYVRDGRLHHPYVWGYRRETERGLEYSAKYRAGWDVFPVWEYPDGIAQWVTFVCGDAIAHEQFPVSAPIHLDERLVHAWVLSRTHREKEIHGPEGVKKACETDLDKRMTYFEMRTENCRPTRGFPCAYQAACHNAEVNRDPLASGLYKRRVPHHELEQIGFDTVVDRSDQ